jgi:hypothetical protein
MQLVLNSLSSVCGVPPACLYSPAAVLDGRLDALPDALVLRDVPGGLLRRDVAAQVGYKGHKRLDRNPNT